MGLWRGVVIGLRMSRDVGPSRRDRSPSQGWGNRKGPNQCVREAPGVPGAGGWQSRLGP